MSVEEYVASHNQATEFAAAEFVSGQHFIPKTSYSRLKANGSSIPTMVAGSTNEEQVVSTENSMDLEDMVMIDKAINKLDIDSKLIVYLVLLGHSIAEVADILDVPKTTAYRRYEELILFLQKELVDEVDTI